ncbi:hypothetical protein M0R04_14825, partial [Candidatus Dojkabacteria bacterium]|nr:hypothetical protein [Candidatus Dojkabacteria bacterium]
LLRREGENKKLLLAYGFRRLSACKKLGWETIPAYLLHERAYADIPIKDIVILDNTRFNDSDAEFIELMNSIKQHGLLEPIGLNDIGKTTKANFIIVNLLENIHRKDITPLELSKAIADLRKENYNLGEIASALNQSPGRIKSLYDMSLKVPPKVMEKMSFIKNKRDKKGALPVTVSNMIVNRHWVGTKKTRDIVFKKAQQDEYTTADIHLLHDLTGAGMEINKAIRKREKYSPKSISVVLVKKEYENNKEYRKYGITDLINLMLIGKVALNPKLFYYKQRPQRKKKD